MDSGAALRRSTRAAARATLTKLRAAASGAAAELGSPEPPPAKQPRKRARAAKCSEPPAAAVAAARVPVDDVTQAALEPETAEAGSKPQRREGGGRKKAGAAGAGAAAAAGPSRDFEEELWQQGYAHVAGVDEAGRGPLAGPVVAAACVIPPHVHVAGIDDSKKLSGEQRVAVFAELTSHPEIRWATTVVEAGEIDEINILQAAMKAMEGAAAGLPAFGFVLVDGNRLPKAFDPERSRTIVKGDSKCYAIAAASIIAKVTRDRLMDEHHERYPQYNFGQHKGYGVPAHVEAIKAHGPCPIHRRSFAPVKHWYAVEEIGKAQ